MIKEFINYLKGKESKLKLLVNEVRSKFEKKLYKKLLPWYMFGKLKGLHVEIDSPPYFRGKDCLELMNGILDCHSIISSRYHSVLAAAYAGCRVGVIARSSKLEWLAKDLNLPFVSLPITLEKLIYLYDSAAVCEKNALDKAQTRVYSAIDDIKKIFIS